jgi:hypothetical protein
MAPDTIMGINKLHITEKREIYARLIPSVIFDRFNLSPYLVDNKGNDLLILNFSSGSSSTEMSVFHEVGFQDPVLYGHITDTINGQIHVLLYILNNPDSPRFDVDKLPDGSPTKFGTYQRNIDAEVAAMNAGLAPGQIRSGLRMLSEAIESFETFIRSLKHDLYFVEPLYYHNAVIFERNGFDYLSGRRLMKRINKGFSESGDLVPLLNHSTPFRQAEAVNSVRLRSWAIHDGILGDQFDGVTMYKQIGKVGSINTTPECQW